MLIIIIIIIIIIFISLFLFIIFTFNSYFNHNIFNLIDCKYYVYCIFLPCYKHIISILYKNKCVFSDSISWTLSITTVTVDIYRRSGDKYRLCQLEVIIDIIMHATAI